MILNKNNKFGLNFVDIPIFTVSGATTDTILGSVTVPANTFIDGDVAYFEGYFEASGSTSGFITAYVNTGTTLTGATQIMIRSFNAGATLQTQSRTMHIVRSDGSLTGTTPDRGTIVTASGTGIFNDFRSATISYLPINWKIDQEIIFTCRFNTPVSPASFVTLYCIKVWTF